MQQAASLQVQSPQLTAELGGKGGGGIIRDEENEEEIGNMYMYVQSENSTGRYN